MKTVKIIYWATTLLVSCVFTTTGTLYLIHNPVMFIKLHDLGYPVYLLNILGLAKILGSITLIVPKFPRLKEWAYAGFVFDLIGAFWSHLVVQNVSRAIPVLVPLALVTISYVMYRKLQQSAQFVVEA